MTDRELLVLAATAAGYDTGHRWNVERMELDPPVIALCIPNVSTMWNPLEDDGDALRLAVVLGLDILHDERSTTVKKFDSFNQTVICMVTLFGNHASGAPTRRAIVIAAASCRSWDKEPVAISNNTEAMSERELIRREHAEWSQATFGDIGPIGPLKHLSKEALEAAADPADLLEWADMQFLLWDAQRRMGISDELITRAMIEKLAINKAREWPEPKDGEPRLHIKPDDNDPRDDFEKIFSMPAHVVRCGTGYCVTSYNAWDGNTFVDRWEGWNACRVAMATGSQL